MSRSRRAERQDKPPREEPTDRHKVHVALSKVRDPKDAEELEENNLDHFYNTYREHKR